MTSLQQDGERREIKSPMPKQSDDELQTILDQYDFDVSGAPKHWKRTDENQASCEKAKQAIHHYAQKMVVEELKVLPTDIIVGDRIVYWVDISDRIAAIEKGDREVNWQRKT